MSCQICLNSFNRYNYIPRVLQCCSRSLCSSCCQLSDRQGIKNCPFCRKAMETHFIFLNKNHDLIDSLPEWNSTSCQIHHTPNILICETCEKEICTKCMDAHHFQGHNVFDIDLFLNDVASKLTDYSDWIERAKVKIRENQNLVLNKRNWLKDSVRKSFEERISLLEFYEKEALDKIDKYFDVANQSLLTSESDQPILGVLDDCINFLKVGQDFLENKEEKNKVIELVKYNKLNRLVTLKKWAENDEKDMIENVFDKFDFEFSLQIPNNPFNILIRDHDPPTYTCVLNENLNNNIFKNPEKLPLIKRVNIFDIDYISQSSLLRPIQGLIKHVIINTHSDVTQEEISCFIEDFRTMKNLETLELSLQCSNKINYETLYQTIKEFKSLKSLTVHSGNLNYEIMANVLNFENLTEFNIENNENSEDLKLLFPNLLKCKDLRKLSLTLYPSSTKECKKFLLSIKTITELRIKFRKESKRKMNSLYIDYIFKPINKMELLSTLGLELEQNMKDPIIIKQICRSIEKAPVLKDLSLSVNFAEKKSHEIMAKTILKLKSLESFNFKYKFYLLYGKQAIDEIIKAISSLDQLRSLNLRIVTFKLSELIQAFPKFTNIEILILDTRLDHIDASKLKLSNLTQLKTLTLVFHEGKEITDDEVFALMKELKHLNCLNRLFLDFNYCELITDESVDMIGYSLQKLSEIESLRLNFENCVQLSDKAIQYMTKFLKQLSRVTLIELNFCCNENITHESIKNLIHTLRDLPRLTNLKLFLENCPQISDEMIEKYREALRKFPNLMEILI